jgi:HSP20 family protein
MPLPANRPRSFAEMFDLGSRFDRMFEDLFDRTDGTRRLAIDVIDEDDAIVVRADVPGIDPDKVKVEVKDDILTVSAEFEESSEEKDKRFLRRERRYGSFTRSIALPPGVNPDAIKATHKNGVVEIRVPRPEPAEPKRVEIATE